MEHNDKHSNASLSHTTVLKSIEHKGFERVKKASTFVVILDIISTVVRVAQSHG